MKKFIISLMAALLFAAPAFALEATVPEFGVYIDGSRLSHANTEYPLLLYNDITYFPMTYDYVRQLGLTSSWIDGEFSIAYYNSTKPYFPSGSYTWRETPGVCIGTPAAYDIYVNGKKLDNAAEEYPVFNYNGITYFPLTWRFATEEFGLEISWDGGLHINKSRVGTPFELYNVEDGRAYFEFRSTEDTDGSVETVSAYFDAAAGSFGIGRVGYSEEAWTDSENVRLDGGRLMYGNLSAADVSAFTEKYAETACFALERGLGDTTVVYAQVYALGQGQYLSRRDIAFAVRGNRIIALADSEGELSQSFGVSKAEEIGGTIYVSLMRGLNSYSYDLVSLSEDGRVTLFADADHNNVELVGEINGRPIIRATWQTADNSGEVSLVNDGFFAIEPDGSRSRIYRFVDSDAYFTANNRLYLAIERTGKLLDTATGQEYDYAAWIESWDD